MEVRRLLKYVFSNADQSMQLLRQEAEQASKALEELKKDITAFKAQISKKNKEDAESKITALENKITALEAHIEKQDKMIIALQDLARTVVEKGRDVESLASRLRELSEYSNYHRRKWCLGP